MNKSVEKFKEYLREKVEESKKVVQSAYLKKARNYYSNNKIPLEITRQIVTNEVIKEYEENGYIKEKSINYELFQLLNIPEKQWKNTVTKFVKFDQLSEVLLNSDLNVREMFDVVIYMIWKNVKHCSEHARSLDYEEIKKLKMPSMTEEEFRNFILGKDFVRFLNARNEELNEEELKLKQDINKILQNSNKQSASMIAQRMIKRHYFNKEVLKETDIKIVYRAFKILGVSSKLCESFQFLLEKELKNQNKKTENNIVIKKDKEKEKMSQKEYDQIFRKIEKYYDIQNQRVIRPLTLDETIYIVSLMFKINIKESEIKKCVQTINKEGLEAYKNSLTYFNAYYEKMLNCSDNPEISKALQTISEYLQEMYVTDSESYLFWKEAIDKELQIIKPILNKNAQYELNEGRKLLLKQDNVSED